jgi:cell division transport system permease protein
MASKRKMDAKAFAHQKRSRRKWVTFWRMCRYGINNFTRNAWLSIAATAVMTITLFVIFTSVASREVLVDTVDVLRDRVDMSVYVQNEIEDDAVAEIQQGLQNLETVTSVVYISPEDAREQFIQQNADSPDTLEAVTEATNRFPGTFSVRLVDINDIDELREFVETDPVVQENTDPARQPSFAGERRESIATIGRAATFAQQVGIGTSAVFVIISMLIIFNTIRMAIFNRREEIQMMKLIGAEKSFIRGPFLVEAIVYGFFAALFASGLGYLVLYLSAPALSSYQINVQPTLDTVTFYAGFVLLGMIIVGAIIGIISSLLATRRYLRL